MEGRYLTSEEIKTLETLLKECAEDSLHYWQRTRLFNQSPSMVCDGNVSKDLVSLFDRVKELI